MKEYDLKILLVKTISVTTTTTKVKPKALLCHREIFKLGDGIKEISWWKIRIENYEKSRDGQVYLKL